MNVHRFKSKVLIFLSDFNNCWIFSTDLRKVLQIYFIKTHPMAGNLFHFERQTDGRTDKHNVANSQFSQFLFGY